jgi:hypothetical protein
MELGELVVLEGSLLRTLCLTINRESSELKNTILNELSEDDFYFPVTKAVFGTVAELHRQDYKINPQDLQEALRRLAVTVPDDFYIEDLFVGDVPTLNELKRSLERIKNGSETEPTAKGEEINTHPTISAYLSKPRLPQKTPPSIKRDEPAPSPPPIPETEGPDLEISSYEPKTDSVPDDQSVAPDPVEVKKEQEAPPLPRQPEAPIGEKAATPSKVITQVTPVSETRKRAMQKPSAVDRAKPDPLTAKPKQPDRPTAGDDVSPESNDWLDYLEHLSSKQGKRLMSGFAGLDDKWGGLRLGLMLIADEDQNRARDFLKQLTDQIAWNSKASCLYVSFDLSKEALRLRTISRLAGVSAEDMENGRFEKDSPEWRKVLSAGREAMEWLGRVYVTEAGGDLSSSSVRDLSQRILGSEKGSMGLVALDSFKRLGGRKDSVQTMAELKELAESQSLLVVTAAQDFTLLSRANADLSVRLNGNSTDVELAITQSMPAKSLALRFQYHPDTHRFIEKND